MGTIYFSLFTVETASDSGVLPKEGISGSGGREQTEVPYELASLTRELLEDYLHDMALMQDFAALNRRIIKEVIVDRMKLNEEGSFQLYRYGGSDSS